ncbi:hypothetical protein DSM19430T_17130 [Desulfovibrio psychrotolerans]|uniref:histidine kinase n=1 Tax=Desulfovibrio psychrotolerans TaxID=415242 RepID=A0A7J0BTI3_9BACT|nr:hypothetical protein DSM19430T_17130 [Desulfovibrio psychrotolerans]
MGEVALGIAHEVNTPLGIIAQEVELLRVLFDAERRAGRSIPAEADESLAQILGQVQRCGEITHSMLSLAGGRPPIPQKADVADIVEGMVGLVEREAQKRGIALVRRYPACGSFGVATDPPMLRQVVLNLLENAMLAVERGGSITVCVVAEEPGFWTLRVRDSGCGIAQEHIGRVFNPFFTTRPPGQGTGLGLAICASIVHRLGGSITVGSTPGTGTEVSVCLPADVEA